MKKIFLILIVVFTALLSTASAQTDKIEGYPAVKKNLLILLHI